MANKSSPSAAFNSLYDQIATLSTAEMTPQNIFYLLLWLGTLLLLSASLAFLRSKKPVSNEYNKTTENEKESLGKSLVRWLERKRYQYEVTFSLYMMTSTEKFIFST
jgi:Small subunit of serine palmitoyltransferase-like